MNEKFKDYLKDLPPELQEKAKDIKTREELTAFLSDNDVELPEDVLESVSGGNLCNDFSFGNPDACPKGGDHEWAKDEVFESGNVTIFHCTKCGKETVRRRNI